ncbi:MAG TPA: VWA domain-containing protein [Pyrinomonadaceae bacterium]|nr:VWA domain-containing protein [Pyrinomonadaceae bacterium]
MKSPKALHNSAFLVFTIFVFAAIGFGQTPTPKPTPDDEVIKVESRLIMVPASVTDANGNAVLGLTANDFVVKEGNERQEIESVGNADKVPLEIALLFDISATTSPMFRFQQETAAKFLLDVMRDQDRAAIFTVGKKPTLISPRSSAAESVSAIRGIIPTTEFTAFYDSVAAAADYLKRNSPEGTRRVVVVISDGEDTNSVAIEKAINDGYKKVGDKLNSIDTKALYQLTVKARNDASASERVRVSRLLQNADTVFYSINPAGSSYQLNKMSVFGQENMQQFADQTGGNAFLPKFQPIDTKDTYTNDINRRNNATVLDRIFNQLTNELRSQYLIQYYADENQTKGTFVKLSVETPNRAGTRIRARQGYYVTN